MPARLKGVDTQKAHLTKKEIQERKEAESLVKTGVDQILQPPAWLGDPIAVEEWNRVLPQILELGLAGNLDLANLAGYCNAYSNYRRASQILARDDLVFVNIDEETGNTWAKENPMNQVCIKWGTEMRRFADLCGLTINSRLKVGQAKQKEKGKSIEDEFGDI